MACFLGMKTRTLSRYLTMTLLASEGVTGQYIPKHSSGGVSMPAFPTCYGMGLQLVVPLPSSISSGTSSSRSSLKLTFTYSHLCLLQGYSGIVTCSQANPPSGTSGCLSEMAFAVHHLTHWGSAACTLLHQQWHRVTLLWGIAAASNGHCINSLVETSRKPDKNLWIIQNDFLEAFKFNA